MAAVAAIALFLLVMCVAVLAFDGGRLLAGRLVGLRVEQYRLGVGPTLLAFEVGETEYTMKLVPLGGAMRFSGAYFVDEGQCRDPRAYLNQTVGTRLFVASAGAISSACVVWTVLFALFTLGKSSPTLVLKPPPTVSPAGQAGLKENDRVVAVDGQSVHDWAHVALAVAQTRSGVVELSLVRDGRPFSSRVAFDKSARRSDRTAPKLGLVPLHRTDRYRPADAAVLALRSELEIVTLTFSAISTLARGGDISGMETTFGSPQLLYLMAVIAANLGVLNMLPFGPLCGGEVAFLIAEAIRGRPVSYGIRERYNLVTIGLLMALMIGVILSNVMR